MIARKGGERRGEDQLTREEAVDYRVTEWTCGGWILSNAAGSTDLTGGACQGICEHINIYDFTLSV